MKYLIPGVAALLLLGAGAACALEIEALYLERQVNRPPVLSNLDAPPDDLGLAGARLALQDNRSTGKFLKQDYALEEVVIAPDADFTAAAEAALADGPGLIIANMPAEDLLALAEMAPGALILNGAAPDDRLRRGDCRANILHTLPSRAMLTDALAQMLLKKRWTEWFLIEGEGPGDADYADALRASARKFGAKIMGEKIWVFDADMRRNAAQEVPLFTQGPDYDVVITADEIRDWARYVPYNTWLPRPVAGTEGLTPAAWSSVVEQWGAVQLNNRFSRLAGRGMKPEDYGLWAAFRAIGEAVTRTKSDDPGILRAFMLSGEFELAGFKGRKMSFRHWNGQMRQPVPLTHPGALAGQAPFEGFLHRRTELDTLGQDEPETDCEAFR